MKLNSKIVGAVIGMLFSSAVTLSSVRADSVRQLDTFGDSQNYTQSLDDFGSHHFGYLLKEHSDNGLHLGFSMSNNGKHLGTSISAVELGPRLTAVNYYVSAATTPNPEPATMVLLGTGLAAFGAYARRKYRR